MLIDQPVKRCLKCLEIIPANGDQVDEYGFQITDEKGKLVYEPRALLACKGCAIKASEGMPPMKRQYKRLEANKQDSFLVPDLPVIKFK